MCRIYSLATELSFKFTRSNGERDGKKCQIANAQNNVPQKYLLVKYVRFGSHDMRRNSAANYSECQHSCTIGLHAETRRMSASVTSGRGGGRRESEKSDVFLDERTMSSKRVRMHIEKSYK